MNNNNTQESQNNLKVETISTSQLDEDQNDQEGQNNDVSNEQESQDNNNNNNNNNNKSNQDDANIKFSCKCGKYYSRNASLFNHIRIKHDNKITEWKVFEGMRKQGRPKKEQNTMQPGSILNGGLMPDQMIDMHGSKIQSKKEISQELLNSKKYSTFPYESEKNNQKMKFGDDISQKLQMDRFYQQMQQNAPPQNPFVYLQHLYNPAAASASHYYQDKFAAEQQQQQYSIQQRSSAFSLFLQSLQEEKPRHSLSMDIITRFKDILIDSNEEPLTEKEEVDHLIKLFNFQHTLFTKHKIDYESHRQQFECFYTFLRYWMKYIKKDKVDSTFQEYITFQFSRIFKVNIDQSAVMERLQKIYDDFEKKSKGSSNAQINGATKSSSNAAQSQNTQANNNASNNAASANNTANSQQLSSPSESAELLPSFPIPPSSYPHIYPPHYHHKFYPPTHYPPSLHNPAQPIMNPLGFPIPPESLYGNPTAGGLPYPHSENDPTFHLYKNQPQSYYPLRPPHPTIPYPPYIETSFNKAGAAAAAQGKGYQSFPHNIHLHDKKHTTEPLKESR